jgi:hypothetical protein
MTERFSEIEKTSIAKPSLEERLGEYPELKAKIETMLAIIENAGGDVEKAAEAERDGSSNNCGKWATRFSTVGPVASSRKRKRNTALSRA